jgi:hypothetical protein
LQKCNSPTTNTRKDIEHAKETVGNVIVRKPRHKNIPNPSAQEKDHSEGMEECNKRRNEIFQIPQCRNGGMQQKDTNGGAQKDVNVPKQEKLGSGDVPDIEIPMTTMQTYTLSMKRTVLHATG